MMPSYLPFFLIVVIVYIIYFRFIARDGDGNSDSFASAHVLVLLPVLFVAIRLTASGIARLRTAGPGKALAAKMALYAAGMLIIATWYLDPELLGWMIQPLIDYSFLLIFVGLPVLGIIRGGTQRLLGILVLGYVVLVFGSMMLVTWR